MTQTRGTRRRQKRVMLPCLMPTIRASEGRVLFERNVLPGPQDINAVLVKVRE